MIGDATDRSKQENFVAIFVPRVIYRGKSTKWSTSRKSIKIHVVPPWRADPWYIKLRELLREIDF